jgi:hypothetical protein
MADDVELIVQIPAGGELDRNLSDETPPSVTSGQVLIERLPAGDDGRILSPETGEVVLSVLSPEALAAEDDEVRRVIEAAAADGDPLVILVQDAEHLREDELAPVLAAAARTRRMVIVCVLASN